MANGHVCQIEFNDVCQILHQYLSALKKIYIRKYFLLLYRIRPDLDPNTVFDIGLTCSKKMFLN
jgi:hypothetical protein